MPVVIVPAGIVAALFITAIGLATAYLTVFLVGFIAFGVLWAIYAPIKLIISEQAANFASKRAGTINLTPDEIARSILEHVRPKLGRFSVLDIWEFQKSDMKFGYRENIPVINNSVQASTLTVFFGVRLDWKQIGYIGYYVGCDNVIVIFAGPAYHEYGVDKYNNYICKMVKSHYKGTYFNAKHMKFTTNSPTRAVDFILENLNAISRNITAIETEELSSKAEAERSAMIKVFKGR